MSGQDRIDTQFLKETVADVVVKACSECAVAQPKDPVGYVAGWLDQFVRNDAILKKLALEKSAAEADAAAEAEVRPYPPRRRRVSPTSRFPSVDARLARVPSRRASRPPRSMPDSGIPGATTAFPTPRLRAVLTFSLSPNPSRPKPPPRRRLPTTRSAWSALSSTSRRSPAIPTSCTSTRRTDTLKLSSDGGAAPRRHVADLEAPEEDEMAETDGDGDEENADETPPPADDEDGAADEDAATVDYGEMFFRYVSAAGPKGHDQDWLVGRKLERGAGVSFALVDDTPKAPWIDVPNAMTFRGAPRPIPEGVDPRRTTPSPMDDGARARGFPRVGAFFAVPITLETGEVAGMLCMDTLKTPTGGSGRAIREEDKDLMRRVASVAAKALDAAARTRARKPSPPPRRNRRRSTRRSPRRRLRDRRRATKRRTRRRTVRAVKMPRTRTRTRRRRRTRNRRMARRRRKRRFARSWRRRRRVSTPRRRISSARRSGSKWCASSSIS